MMKREDNKERIREFCDLIDDRKLFYALPKFKKPVLVYEDVDGEVHYSLWEESLLKKYGLEYVDGWDYKSNSAFCPDWMFEDDEEEDDIDDDDDDFDFKDILDLTKDGK